MAQSRDKVPPNHIDAFEEAFQNAFTTLVQGSGDSGEPVDKDDVRSEAEQAILKFLEAGKAVEAFFLQKRLLLSAMKPEQIVKEDCFELRAELARKDELLHRLYDKIAGWQTMLLDLPGGAALAAKPPPSLSTPTQIQPVVNLPSQSPMNPKMNPMMPQQHPSADPRLSGPSPQFGMGNLPNQFPMMGMPNRMPHQPNPSMQGPF